MKKLIKKIVKRISFLFLFLSFLTYSYGVEENPETDLNKFRLGEKIQLKIEGKAEEELKEIFKEVENLTLSKSKFEKGVRVIFRNWELGEKKFNFGEFNENIFLLNIETNLDKEVEKEKNRAVFLDYSDKTATKKTLPTFPYLFILGLILSVFSLISLLKREKKEKKLSPEERFELKTEIIDRENYTYELSYALREYIDSTYSSSFLNGKYEKVGVVEEKDVKFIKNLDYIKFSGKTNSERENVEVVERIVREIYEKIKREKNKKEKTRWGVVEDAQI